jgi:hypothetical protein
MATDELFEMTSINFEGETINFLRGKVTLQFFERPPDVTRISTSSVIRSHVSFISNFLDFLSTKQLAN